MRICVAVGRWLGRRWPAACAGSPAWAALGSVAEGWMDLRRPWPSPCGGACPARPRRHENAPWRGRFHVWRRGREFPHLWPKPTKSRANRWKRVGGKVFRALSHKCPKRGETCATSVSLRAGRIANHQTRRTLGTAYHIAGRWPAMWPLAVLAASSPGRREAARPVTASAVTGEAGATRATASAPAMAAGPQAGAWGLSSG